MGDDGDADSEQAAIVATLPWRLRRTERRMVAGAARSERRERRRHRLERWPLPWQLLAFLGGVFVASVVAGVILDANGYLLRHPLAANLVTAVIGGSFGIPAVAGVLTIIQRRQLALPWVEVNAGTAARLVRSAFRLSVAVAGAVPDAEPLTAQRWFEVVDVDMSGSRFELIELLYGAAAARSALGSPRFLAVDVQLGSERGALKCVRDLHRTVEQALSDLAPSPSFVHAAPALHELRSIAEGFESHLIGRHGLPPDADRPPRTHTTTWILRDLLETVTTACLLIEPTAKREYARNVEGRVRSLLEVDDFELRDADGTIINRIPR